MMIVAQPKFVSYYNRHFKNDFIPLTIEIFGCLHQHVDNFFHRYGNMAWLAKGLVVLLFQLYVHFISRGC